MITLGMRSRMGIGRDDAPRPSNLIPIEAGTSKDLMLTLRSVIERGNALFDWLDSERDRARSLGIESIIVELLALVEGVRLRHIYDALEDAVESNTGCEITEEGISALHRAERLVADAEKRIPESARPSRKGMVLSGPRTLSQDSGSSNTLTILALVFMGTIGLAALAFALYMATRNPK